MMTREGKRTVTSGDRVQAIVGYEGGEDGDCEGVKGENVPRASVTR
jgi:hypothetical protein